ncbi:MAG: hypothetical protein ACI8XD_001543, partial [Thermoproteota archaeon]
PSATGVVSECGFDTQRGEGIFFKGSQPRKIEWLVDATYTQNSHVNRLASN